MRAYVFCYLEFLSYLKANDSNRFHFLLKVLLPSKFIGDSTYLLLKQMLKKQPDSKQDDTLCKASLSFAWKLTMR